MINIAQLTDCHLSRTANEDYEAKLARIVDAIEALDVDAVFATGDIADDGSIEAYERFCEITERLSAPVYCIPGNHDNVEVMRSIPSLDVPGVVCLGDWQIVCVDTAVPGEVPGGVSAEGLAQLAAFLAKPHRPYTGLFMHHPLAEVGTAWIDPQRVRNAHQVAELLSHSQHVRWIANGHVHQSRADQYCGIDWFCTPATCRQFTENSHDFAVDTTLEPGFRIFKLAANGEYETEVRRLIA